MIQSWSTGAADDWMAEDILTGLSEMVWRHPWWHARARLLLALLRKYGVEPPARVLDAGCGWGVNLAALERGGYQVTGLDVSRQTLQRLDRPDRDLVEADLTQALPTTVGVYDAVIALDVIEHLDDDAAVVGRLGRLLKPHGGVFVVSVPALPELYSDFDAVQGHRRRYLPQTLRAAFAQSDLRIEDVFWWGSWMVPLLRFQRQRGRVAAVESSPMETYRHYLTLPPWPISLALRFAFALDHRRTLRGKAQTGTSLFAVARR
jgi:SAM-dependent methyltransferase